MKIVVPERMTISAVEKMKISYCRDMIGSILTPDSPFATINNASNMAMASSDSSDCSQCSQCSVVDEFIDFMNNSWTPFHATLEAEKILTAAGYARLSERRAWQLKRGGKYYITRNMSSIVAFAIGEKFEAGEGFFVVGAHTDSPCPKLKPISKLSRPNFLLVGVQPYGDGVWHTWFDRDLSVAGRVLVRRRVERETFEEIKNRKVGEGGTTKGGCFGGGESRTTRNAGLLANAKTQGSPALASVIKQELVMIRRPIMRIPTLAIHLDRPSNDKGICVNFQRDMGVLLATSIKSEMNQHKAMASRSGKGKPLLATTRNNKHEVLEECHGTCKGSSFIHAKDRGRSSAKNSPAVVTTMVRKVEGDEGCSHHHPLLLQLLADELKCKPSDICDFDLCVCDTQPSAIGGALDEFILSGRLDNLPMSFCAAKALAESTAAPDALANESGVRMIGLFDNEEVGSVSAQGASSTLISGVIRRVTEWATTSSMHATPSGLEGLVAQSCRRSFLVSADMAHAVHPNYVHRHDEVHQPMMHGGLVIKHNANQDYATSAATASVFREIGYRMSLPIQDYVNRCDIKGGSTIGPLVAAQLGIPTVDVGAPMLSMHSIREMCSADDIDHAFQHFKAYFETVGDMLLEVSLES